MTGKEKCTLLRQIRKEIAESNGIVYLTSECTHEGDCPGFCPKCDAEIRYLDNELNRKAEQGEKISIAGISLNTFNRTVTDKPQKNGADNGTDNKDDDLIDGQFEPSDILPPDKSTVVGEIRPFPKYNFKMTIEEMDFSENTYNQLKKADINLVADLCSFSESQLSRKKHIGRGAIEEITQKLARMGLSLKN